MELERNKMGSTVGCSVSLISGRPARVWSALAAWCLGVAFASPGRAEPSELSPELGFNYLEVETPRITALGGAQRAFSNSLEALFQNPANMATTRVYHVGGLAEIWPEARRQSYGVAAVDSIVSSARLAGGIGGVYSKQDPDGIDRTHTNLVMALALPVSEKFFVGLGGKYLWLSQDGAGPLGPSRVSAGLPEEEIVSGFGLDAGLTVKPTDSLALAVVANNLNSPDHGFLPLSVGGGAGYGTQDLTLEADLLSDFTTYDEARLRAMLGFELLLGDHFPLRAGYRYDEGLDNHGLSFGVGYLEPTFSISLGVRRYVGDEAATAVALGFVYHVDSSGLTPSPAETF